MSSLLGFLAVVVTAAVVTVVVTPVVGALARSVGVLERPQDPRRDHREPVPTLGGLAMIGGLVAAFGVAYLLPAFRDVFATTSEPVGLLAGVGLLALVGVVDDVKGLSPPVKLAGQILAASAPVLFGIQIVYAWVPTFDGVIALSPDLGFPLTVLALVAMINAVNLIDGLDGLAAGVVGIAAIAFAVYLFASGGQGVIEAVPNSAPVVAAAVIGMCVGFLFHNFHPARIFMGDTGSMVLGLLLGAAGIAYVGRTTAPTDVEFYGSVPLLIPALVLAIPFLDTAFAVARRTFRRQPITVGDKEHLHHLLIAFGHSHRRAVLTLYYWSLVLAVASVGPVLVPRETLTTTLALAVVGGVALTAFGVRRGDHDAEREEREPESRRDIG